jgi:hypothetical protein
MTSHIFALVEAVHGAHSDAVRGGPTSRDELVSARSSLQTHKKSAKRKLRQHALVQATYCVFAARSASVSHLSAISMKKDLCGEVRAASANRMHSAAFSRNWSKLGKGASISILR